MIPAPTQRDERPWPARVVSWVITAPRSLVHAVPAAVEGYFRHRLSQQAAGIAYRVLFSLAPLAIVVVWVAGILLKDESLRADVTDRVVDWLPVSEDGKESVEQAITHLASPSGAVGLVSIALFAWASTGMMGSLRTGLEAALETERRRPAVRAKIVDLILVAGAGILVLSTIAIAFAAQVVTRLMGDASDEIGVGGWLLDLTGVVAPLIVSTVVVILIYRFVPSRRVSFGDALAGGVVTGLLLVTISAASALVYNQVAGLSVIFGSITAVLVFLYTMYLYASALLFGAELASAWSAPREPSSSEPLVGRVRRAVLGLVVRQEDPRPVAREEPVTTPEHRADES